MVGRGASLDSRLFLGGTDGSNPVPSSGESANHRPGMVEAVDINAVPKKNDGVRRQSVATRAIARNLPRGLFRQSRGKWPPRRLRSLVVNSPPGSTLTWDMLRGMGDPGGHPIRRRADDPTRCRTRLRRSHRPLPPSGVTATPKRGAAAERACPDLASLPFASRVGPESRGLLVEPEVFEAPAVVNAVDHRSEPVDIRLPTARSPRMINDWSGAVLSQDTLDLPD